MNQIKPYVILFFVLIGITFLIWLPHFLAFPQFFKLDFSQGFNNIYRNFDGINYVVIAKSLYLPEKIAELPQSLPAVYYAAHFPGYPLAMIIFAPFLGFLKSMILTSLLFTLLSVWTFYKLVKDFELTKQPLWLSILFLVLPARWLIVHSVGSAEPMFIWLTISSIYCFMKFEAKLKIHWIWLAGLFGALAQLTRPPGILLFGAYGLYLLWKLVKTRENLWKLIRNYFPIGLIPLTLIAVFSYYGYAYGDFWTYFKTGDNIHLSLSPFYVFNKAESWVGDIWLEDLVYIYLFGYLASFTLIKQKQYPMAVYTLTYTIAASLVAHRDISRYILPIFPFVLIAFEKALTTKEFKIVMGILALAIYLYAQNFLIANTGPYPNLEYFN